MVRTYSSCLLALAVAAGCGGSDPAPQPPANFAIDSTRARLDNGLEVMVVPDRSVPTVTAMVAFRSGAFVESEAQSGYSHLLEHMIWKGSADVPDPVQFRNRLQALGALTNATTDDDLVTYYEILPREHLDEGLSLLAGALHEPALDPEALQKEIEVVLAEFDRADSDGDRVQYRRVQELLFPSHPNRKSALGNRETIRMATPEALRELLTTYHVPNNALLLLIGDVDADDARALAEKHFGGWTRAADPFVANPVPEQAPIASNVVEILEADVSDSYLEVAFRGPDAREDLRAAVAADVLSALSGLSDQAFRRVVEAPAVLGAYIFHATARDTGTLGISMVIGSSYEEVAIAQLRYQLEDLKSTIRDEEVAAARDALWARRFFGAEGNLALAFQIANGWSITDLEYGTDYVSILYDLDRDDVAQVVERYIEGQPHVAVLRVPHESVGGRRMNLSNSLRQGW